MTKEIFVTQQKAAEILEEYMANHGRAAGCNLQYMLNDQRRGRRTYRPIPYVKASGRIMYRVPDLKEWADFELAKDVKTHSGIYVIEGDTELDRIIKLSIEVTKH